MGKLQKVKLNKVKLSKTKEVILKKKIPKIKKEDQKIKLILKDEPVSTESNTTVKLNENLVNLAIEGLFKLTKATVSKKLFEDDYPILLQVTLIKIPSCPDRIIRLPLKKTLLTDTSEVCLIVPDLKKGRRVDYEPTIEHYENLLRENNIKNITKVIPLNAIKTEHDQFELKRRLVGQYDQFLTDGRICGHLSHLLGKVFYIKRKLPTPVHLSQDKIKKSIEDALSKTTMHIHAKGNTFITQIGHAKMSINDLTSNVLSVAEAIDKMLPGGWKNIRSLHLKTHLSVAIPIYMTLKSSNDINTPRALSKKPKLSVEVHGKLSTLGDADVRVLPTGEIIIPKFEADNK